MAKSPVAAVPDADLVLAARGGDQEAFGAIYDRYADRIHDFCASLLRDRHDAADATQDTFVIAAHRLGQLREPTKLKSWLYAIARREAVRHGTARARERPTEHAGLDVADPAGGPEDAMSRDESVAIVWDAAAGLGERDRVVLDLHVRQGLSGQELADALGVRPNTASMAVNRLKTQVERALGALLVARLGHDDCKDLREVLAGWDGTFSPLIRKRVARHVDGCETCSESRRRLTSPLALLASVPLVPAPLILRDRVLGHLDADAASGGRSDAARFDRHGFPKGPGVATWKQVTGAIVAGGLIGAAVVIGVDAVRSDRAQRPDRPAPSAAPTTSPQADVATYSGGFTSFPGDLPGGVVENSIELAFASQGDGAVTGASTWAFGTGGGRTTHDYVWSATFDSATSEMAGEIAATVTLLDGSQTTGTLSWRATLDPATGVVTGSVSVPDGGGVIPFTAVRT